VVTVSVCNSFANRIVKTCAAAPVSLFTGLATGSNVTAQIAANTIANYNYPNSATSAPYVGSIVAVLADTNCFSAASDVSLSLVLLAAAIVATLAAVF
jgi:hypothetical protein